jgi:hypothetical protein
MTTSTATGHHNARFRSTAPHARGAHHDGHAALSTFTQQPPCQAIATLSSGEGAQPSETAEKVDFAGRDSIDTETRRRKGRAAALGAAVEANVLP